MSARPTLSQSEWDLTERGGCKTLGHPRAAAQVPGASEAHERHARHDAHRMQGHLLKIKHDHELELLHLKHQEEMEDAVLRKEEHRQQRAAAKREADRKRRESQALQRRSFGVKAKSTHSILGHKGGAPVDATSLRVQAARGLAMDTAANKVQNIYRRRSSLSRHKHATVSQIDEIDVVVNVEAVEQDEAVRKLQAAMRRRSTRKLEAMAKRQDGGLGAVPRPALSRAP